MRILTLIAIAVVLGASVNAVSPRGLSWSRPLGRGVGAEAADAGLIPVGLGSLRGMLKNPSILFIDARPREEYETGHLPGAISLPWTEIEAGGLRARPKFPRERPILVYCANEFCDTALRLGAALREDHPYVAIFVDGYEAWWNAGGDRESK